MVCVCVFAGKAVNLLSVQNKIDVCFIYINRENEVKYNVASKFLFYLCANYMYNILHLKKNINTICTLEMSAHKRQLQFLI